jgi:hypothetical protein
MTIHTFTPFAPFARAMLFVLLLAPPTLFAQQNTQQSTGQPNKAEKSLGFGIKAGINFSDITNASQVNASSAAGFHAGIFLAPGGHSILGSRTELLYSLQGYDESNGQSTGSIRLGYLTLAQLVAINITKYFQLQFGGTLSYLLHAKADSSQPSTGNAEANAILSYYNRIDYGYAVGAEIHPYKGIIIGARYNVSLNNLYKQSFVPTTGVGGGIGTYTAPTINFKNNVVQVSLGYRF